MNILRKKCGCMNPTIVLLVVTESQVICNICPPLLSRVSLAYMTYSRIVWVCYLQANSPSHDVLNLVGELNHDMSHNKSLGR